MSASFDQIGPDRLKWPVILSVPHAGRVYPKALSDDCRHAPTQLRILEDRYADLLVRNAEAQGFSGLIARVPRAWIDLNRAEQDVDPGMLTAPLGPAVHLSAKARGGLGLIPRRTAQLGEIWHRRLTPDQVRARISDDYRPYHTALAVLLKAARSEFGGAILLDVHTMPPLPATGDGPPPQIIIGDRFGRSAAQSIAQQAAHCARAAGYRTAFNVPYAGGHILDRHARPDENIHGLQIEVDRRLYLDAALIEPGPGLPAIAHLIATSAQTLSKRMLQDDQSIAAE